MPHFGDYKSLLDTVFFLYATVEDAWEGKQSGGTGFFATVASDRYPSLFYQYAVTNWHVACEGGCPIVRLNTLDGNTDIITLKVSDWRFIPEKYDIAVAPIPHDLSQHKVMYLAPNFLLSEDEEETLDIGVGEDVFMVGRFVDYDGVQTNQPAARFGNISIAYATVKQPTGYYGRSIVIDLHSRSGFSGSPVFVYRTPGSLFPPASEKGLVWVGGHTMKLLGIHWGQFPEEWELTSKSPAEASLIREGQYVKGFSGMTCVCPSSAILELLNLPEFKEMRSRQDLEIEKSGGPDARVPHGE